MREETSSTASPLLSLNQENHQDFDGLSEPSSPSSRL
jgi:hypothetical protein